MAPESLSSYRPPRYQAFQKTRSSNQRTERSAAASYHRHALPRLQQHFRLNPVKSSTSNPQVRIGRGLRSSVLSRLIIYKNHPYLSLARRGNQLYAGVAHTSRVWRCVRPDARTQTSKPDVCATPCEPPRHRNRAVATRSSLVKAATRRHQKATSAPPAPRRITNPQTAASRDLRLFASLDNDIRVSTA